MDMDFMIKIADIINWSQNLFKMGKLQLICKPNSGNYLAKKLRMNKISTNMNNKSVL